MQGHSPSSLDSIVQASCECQKGLLQNMSFAAVFFVYESHRLYRWLQEALAMPRKISSFGRIRVVCQLHLRTKGGMHRCAAVESIREDFEATFPKCIPMNKDNTDWNLPQRFVRALLKLFAPML